MIQEAFKYVGTTGTYLQFGVPPIHSQVTLNPFDLYNLDLQFIGSMAINHTYQTALDWLDSGRIDIKPLISKVIMLEELPTFFQERKAKDVMKVQISFE